MPLPAKPIQLLLVAGCLSLLIRGEPVQAVPVTYRYVLAVDSVEAERGSLTGFLEPGDEVSGSFAVDASAAPYWSWDPRARQYWLQAGAQIQAKGLSFEPAAAGSSQDIDPEVPGSDFSVDVADGLLDPSIFFLSGDEPVDYYSFSIDDNLIATTGSLEADVGFTLFARGTEDGLVTSLLADGLVPDLSLASGNRAVFYFRDSSASDFLRARGHVAEISLLPEAGPGILLGFSALLCRARQRGRTAD